MRHHIKNNGRPYQQVSARAFTLVEVLVALGIFMLLLVIILVPLNMGMTMLHLGSAKADVQSATQRVIDSMRGDLTKAIYVFPNAQVPPVTDKAPYYVTGTGVHYGPYFQMSGVDTITSASPDPDATAGACQNNSGAVSNLSRLDMVVARTDGDSLITPVQPSYYIVSYYARRRDIAKPYQPIDNPIVLYRAQIPYYSPDAANPGYLKPDGTPALAGEDVNADTSNDRYGLNCKDRGSWWLAESKYGEPNLQPLTQNDAALTSVFTLYGSHVSLIPSGIGMVTGVDYRGYENNTLVTTYTEPKTTFTCADTNKDGIIDQVTLNVLLEKVDDMGAQPRGQDLTLPQVVNLPNVRSITNVK